MAVVLKKKSCKYCGGKFQPRRNAQLYCSRNCQRRNVGRNHRQIYKKYQEPKKESTVAMRSCLGPRCEGKLFRSLSKFNRVCNDCKGLIAYEAQVESYSFSGVNKRVSRAK